MPANSHFVCPPIVPAPLTDSQKLAREMMDLVDHFASTLAQPDDERAWHHLLTYCPKDILADFHAARMMRRIDEIRRGED